MRLLLLLTFTIWCLFNITYEANALHNVAGVILCENLLGITLFGWLLEFIRLWITASRLDREWRQ